MMARTAGRSSGPLTKVRPRTNAEGVGEGISCWTPAAAPRRPHYGVVAGFSSRRPHTHVGEVVGIKTGDLHRVVSVAEIGHRQDDRFFRKIEPRNRIERIVVWRPARLGFRFAHNLIVPEMVDRHVREVRSDRRRNLVPAQLRHVDVWKTVDVSLDTKRIGVLLAPIVEGGRRLGQRRASCSQRQRARERGDSEGCFGHAYLLPAGLESLLNRDMCPLHRSGHATLSYSILTTPGI